MWMRANRNGRLILQGIPWLRVGFGGNSGTGAGFHGPTASPMYKQLAVTTATATFTHPAIYAIMWDCALRRVTSRKDSAFVLMIRLARVGARKQPHYRIVVIEKERARNGRPVEVVGTYNPRTNPASVELKRERVDYWVSKGAQVSDTVSRLLAKPAITSAPATA